LSGEGRPFGLNRQGAHIVHTLAEPIITGLLFAFAGIITVVSSLQVIYERLFEQRHRGWRDLPRSGPASPWSRRSASHRWSSTTTGYTERSASCSRC
jgi:hypothetical protein